MMRGFSSLMIRFNISLDLSLCLVCITSLTNCCTRQVHLLNQSNVSNKTFYVSLFHLFIHSFIALTLIFSFFFTPRHEIK